jgi:3-methylfumaryl-CoA hydratase
LNQTTSLASWVGRTQTEEDEVTLGAVRRTAAMLDQDPDAFHRGGEMPESWYAILFGTTARQATLAPDGHVTTGDFLPPMHNTRRMFAGRRVRFHRPLRVGDIVERKSTVTRVEPKNGRSGPLTLVTIVHELRAQGALAVTEDQDVVYRAPAPRQSGAPGAGQTERPLEKEKPHWSRGITPDTTLLFRYSALTFNAHRIHYDLPYTREAEGYPALVMNGGLTALLLVETARPHLRGAIAGYEARALHPLFVGEAISLNGRSCGDTADLWACGPQGSRAYQLGVSLGKR